MHYTHLPKEALGVRIEHALTAEGVPARTWKKAGKVHVYLNSSRDQYVEVITDRDIRLHIPNEALRRQVTKVLQWIVVQYLNVDGVTIPADLRRRS